MTDIPGENPQDKPAETPPATPPAETPPAPPPEAPAAKLPETPPVDQFDPQRLSYQIDSLRERYGADEIDKYLAEQAGSVDPKQFDQLRQQFGETRLELTRAKIANQLNISEETAAKIPGSTPDEIIKNAEFAAEFAAEQAAAQIVADDDPGALRYNLSNLSPPASDLSPEDEVTAARADLRKAF